MQKSPALHMTPREAIIAFAVYSVLGWCLDTGFRSVVDGYFNANNWLGIPFSPMYGFGALGILWLYRYMQRWSRRQQFLVYAVLTATYEYFGGILSEALLGRRLWNYSRYPLDIGTYTTPFHAIVWGYLAILLIYWLHPQVHSAINRLRIQKLFLSSK